MDAVASRAKMRRIHTPEMCICKFTIHSGEVKIHAKNTKRAARKLRVVQMRCNLASEIAGVLISKSSPFFRQVVGRKDGRDWAYGHTGAAIDALHRIDVELFLFGVRRLVFLRVDAVNWARIHTGGVLGADTGFCDYIGHSDFSDRVEVSTLIVAHAPNA